MVKGPFCQIFLWGAYIRGGGGGACTWTNICVLKTPLFVQALVSAHNLFLLLFFLLLFVFNNTDIVITILQKTIGYQIQFSVFGILHFSPKFNVMCKFNCSKYSLRGHIFGGGFIHGRSFPFQKLVPKRPGAYTQWGLLSEFYGSTT